MTNEISPAIVAKIKKLMNLSQDGAASENEQEIAAAHAQRLMLEYNVSLATVQAQSLDKDTARRMKERRTGGAKFEWQRSLMSTIASVNFCFVTVHHEFAGSKYIARGFDLIGREENVVSTQVMYDYLKATIERLARDYVGPGQGMHMSKAANSFREGAGSRVEMRIRQRAREAKQEQASQTVANNGRSVALLMDDYAEIERCANEDFRFGYEPGTTARRNYLWKMRVSAYDAAVDALKKPEMRDVSDKAMLTQVATQAAEDAISSSGLDGKELAEVLSYAVKNAIKTTHEKAEPVKRGRGRPPGSGWGRASQKTVNHDAYMAGDSAGRNIGLDKQVGTKSGALRIK
jgi:hypothetical protein